MEGGESVSVKIQEWKRPIWGVLCEWTFPPQRNCWGKRVVFFEPRFPLVGGGLCCLVLVVLVDGCGVGVCSLGGRGLGFGGWLLLVGWGVWFFFWGGVLLFVGLLLLGFGGFLKHGGGCYLVGDGFRGLVLW